MLVGRVGFEPTKPRQRIYSPPHLTTLLPTRILSFTSGAAGTALIPCQRTTEKEKDKEMRVSVGFYVFIPLLIKIFHRIKIFTKMFIISQKGFRYYRDSSRTFMNKIDNFQKIIFRIAGVTFYAFDLSSLKR